MYWTRMRVATAVAILAVAALTAGYYRQTWLSWFRPGGSPESADKQPALPADQVVLTRKAQESLNPDAQRLYPRGPEEPYWRIVQLPGEIVDRPGFSDRGVAAPVTGTVLAIHGLPGDVVGPGQALFTLRLVSESLYAAQSELSKAMREIEITKDRRKRLADPEIAGVVTGSRILDLDNQLRRLDASVSTYRQELQTRGLTSEQINAAAEGRFVGKVEIPAPARLTQAARPPDESGAPRGAPEAGENSAPAFEVQELKVELGQQVQAGQTLCLLSDHHWLYIEGHGFPQDIPLVARAVKEGYGVDVEFLTDGGDWPALEQSFQIHHMGNSLDPTTRTFGFSIPLRNQSRTYEKDGRKLLEWRFLPGQRVRLNVRVEKLDDALVLPAEALVREGPEAFVFEKKGDSFLRRPVRVRYADRRDVVLENDGSLPLGLRVVRHGALQLNRMLKAQGGQVPLGFHIHPDGSIHMNADEK